VKKVRTVLRDIPPEALGVTTCHDHIFVRPPKWLTDKDPDRLIADVDKSTAEMNLYKMSGGQSFVDATTIEYGRDIRTLRQISERTGIHIIATSGYNQDMFAKPWIGDRTPQDLEELLVKEVTEGVENTGIRCGVVKASSAYNQISPLAESLLRACARAQKRTGAPALTTAELGTVGLERLDIFESERVDLTRVCVAHGDLNPDPWYIKDMMSRGAFVGFDNLGKVKYQPDSVRVKVLRELVDAGHQKQILLGMDLGSTRDLKAYQGGLGLGYLLNRFVPRLREEGFNEEVINDFLVENPKRWLAF
jgi:predicted metal-dependent phosphotriesterase family hydrolase